MVVRSRALLDVIVMAFFLGGCAGASYSVSADRLKYPASLSPALQDGRGKTLSLDDDLQPAGDFSFSRTSVGFLYGMTGTTIDLSDDLNREVEARRGEGIVRLALRPKLCASSWFFPLTILPFYPGCQNVSVTGTVVTRKQAVGEPRKTMP